MVIKGDAEWKVRGLLYCICRLATAFYYLTSLELGKYTVRRVWFFQRGQKNVRNHTQVKLAATSLECKQAGTFQYTSVCVGGRFRLITRIREKN